MAVYTDTSNKQGRPFYYTLVSTGPAASASASALHGNLLETYTLGPHLWNQKLWLSLANLKDKNGIISYCYYNIKFSITTVNIFQVSFNLFIFKSFLNVLCLFIVDLMFSLSICMTDIFLHELFLLKKLLSHFFNPFAF